MSLEQLQKIRARRLEKQQTEVMAHRHTVAAAQTALAQAHQDLEQFRAWRLNHQEELFKGLQGQSCTPQAMQEYRTKLEILAKQEEQLRAAIPVAQQKLEQTMAGLRKAQQEANALAMKNEKTKEIVETQHKAQVQLALYKEQNQDP